MVPGALGGLIGLKPSRVWLMGLCRKACIGSDLIRGSGANVRWKV